MQYATFDGYRHTIEIGLEPAEVSTAYHTGDCEDDVAIVCAIPYVAAQLDAIHPDAIAGALRPVGAWDDTELADDQANRMRLVWLAAADIADNPECADCLDDMVCDACADK